MAGVLQNARHSLFNEIDNENEFGTITSVTYSYVTAKLNSVGLYDLVHIGDEQRIGEVIKIEGETTTIHVFGNTTGLQVGDLILPTFKPLTAELGPGLMGSIYNGIQNPLGEVEAEGSKIYIQSVVDTSALDRKKMWEFVPCTFKEGDFITGGDIFGKVFETSLVTHWIMLPPKQEGRVIYIAPPGEYTVEEEVIRIEYNNNHKSFTLMQKWPIRQPRPIEEKIVENRPLFTGARVLDCLFPLALGGTCAVPGWDLGCGKSTLFQRITSKSNSDVVVFVACSEQSNDVAEKLLSFNEITTSRLMGAVREPVNKRLCTIANTANFPIAVREASIYTGVTISEYYRDQGLNATLIADNTSHWEASYEEASHRRGESMTSDGGFPASLTSTLEKFYGRAGLVTCLGTPSRTGSVTIISSVVNARRSRQFYDPLVCATLDNCCDAFWGLDPQMARIKHFPEVNWMVSFSSYFDRLVPFYEESYSDYVSLRKEALRILKWEDGIKGVIQTHGKDSLPDEDKVTLRVAEILRYDFLQQNGFTSYDGICPFYKTVWMLRNIITFHNLAHGAAKSKSLSLQQINGNVAYELVRMKFQDPADGEQEVVNNLRRLHSEIVKSFE